VVPVVDVQNLLRRFRPGGRLLDAVSRAYRTPRILDQRITLADDEGPIRQLVVTELGHEDPTLLLTNPWPVPPRN